VTGYALITFQRNHSFHCSNPLYRGQSQDYTVNASGKPIEGSSLYPSLLRPTGKDRISELNKRFGLLELAEEKLKKHLMFDEVHQDRIVRWAILQHYEIVATPLLDVTQSLQTALSFALSGNRDDGYLFVLAFPQLTGPISISIESKTQVIDLTQVCPPEALRPHFQSGILVGDYPVVDCVRASHGGKGLIGNNFACRLISKFKLVNCREWIDEGFAPTHEEILFPNSYDSWFSEISNIKQEL
jgi:hypothetical protein